MWRSQVSKETPFRGPPSFTDGALAYLMTANLRKTGLFFNFSGSERILRQGRIVYEGNFHGFRPTS